MSKKNRKASPEVYNAVHSAVDLAVANMRAENLANENTRLKNIIASTFEQQQAVVVTPPAVPAAPPAPPPPPEPRTPLEALGQRYANGLAVITRPSSGNALADVLTRRTEALTKLGATS
ncbi:MAG: hypothetical protein ABTD50_23325 [Polyangiaceae bacterium]|jgi:hypothetical protein